MTGIADMIQSSLPHSPKSVLALQPSLHARAKAVNPQARGYVAALDVSTKDRIGKALASEPSMVESLWYQLLQTSSAIELHFVAELSTPHPTMAKLEVH